MNQKVTSAGGLIVRLRHNGWETILVGKGMPVVWRIPKGMQNNNETVEDTAIREVLEETGMRGKVLELIDTGIWTYRYEDEDWDETCYFFLMDHIDGTFDEHDSEFDKVEWILIEDAKEMLYYRLEREIVEKCMKILTL